MKLTSRSILIIVSMMILSLATAANADNATIANKLKNPNGFFDAAKMSDMSDWDPANPVTHKGDTIKIAYVNAFSGPAAENGFIHLTPLQFAVHDINKRGGIFVDGKKKLIELIVVDHMSKPDQMKKVCERMILQEKVQFLIGTSGGNLLNIMHATANKYKIISVNEGSVADDSMNATNFYRYSFQPSVSIEQVSRAVAYYYGERKKEKKFYILCQDYGAGHGFAEGFKKGLKQYYPEAEIVGEDYHKLFLTDFAPYLSKINASGAEVIFTADWPPDSGNLMKQTRAMGINIPFAGIFLVIPNELHEVGVEGSKGNVNVDFYNVVPAFPSQYPGQEKIEKAWHNASEKWKTAPYNTSAFEHPYSILSHYLGTAYWLFDVIARAKSTDPEKIIKVWEGDTYRLPNGKVIMMRPCDHKSIQDLAVNELVPWEGQKASFNIPPYYWFKGCSYIGPGLNIPAAKVLPLMDQALESCKGKSDWGE